MKSKKAAKPVKTRKKSLMTPVTVTKKPQPPTASGKKTKFIRLEKTEVAPVEKEKARVSPISTKKRLDINKSSTDKNRSKLDLNQLTLPCTIQYKQAAKAQQKQLNEQSKKKQAAATKSPVFIKRKRTMSNIDNGASLQLINENAADLSNNSMHVDQLSTVTINTKISKRKSSTSKPKPAASQQKPKKMASSKSKTKLLK